MKLSDRLTDVLSRIRFNLFGALTGGERQALQDASNVCATCVAKVSCEKWVAQHPEGGEAAPPSFCPNAAFMRRHEPKQE